MPRNMVTRRFGPLLILRENKETPTDEEWDECLDLLARDVDDVRVLVITDGGGPSPAQRKRLEQTLAGKPVKVAVVSESVKVRFIVSTVALLTANIKSFTLVEYTQALQHLDLDLDLRRIAQQQIREMTAALED